MGTRADFYLRKDGALLWLGSVALDGYDVDEGGEPEGGWPDMTKIKNVTLGNRSGMIVVRPR